MNCLFCNIIKNKIPSYRVYEDEAVLAFLDINPVAPGHTVVVSKHHSESLLTLPDKEVTNLFLAVKKITQQIKDKLKPEAFNVGINMGKRAGQEVEHLHVHIIPRWAGDGGKSINSIVNNPPTASLEEILAKIKF